MPANIDVMIRCINTNQSDLDEIIRRIIGDVDIIKTQDMVGYKLESVEITDVLTHYNRAKALVNELKEKDYQIVIEYIENQSAPPEEEP